MSLNQILKPKFPLDLHCRSINCHSFKINGLNGSSGQVLMCNREGNLEFNSHTASAQRDLYVLTTPISIPDRIYTEVVFPIYRNGAFSTMNAFQLCKIEISLTYFYRNSNGSLPFSLKITNNDIQVYEEEYGILDNYNNKNKITDTLILELNSQSNLKYFVKKLFNDTGYIEIQNMSYVFIEIL